MNLGSIWRAFTAPAPVARKRGPRGPRGKSSDPSIVRARIENRALQRLEKNAPEELDRLVLEKAGYLRPEKEPRSDFEVTLTTVERMKKAGLWPSHDGPRDEQSGLMGVLGQFLGALGSSPAIQERVASAMTPPQPATMPRPQTIVTVETPLPLLEPQQPESRQQETQPLDLSTIAINRLTGRTPAEAARFLVDLHDARATALVGHLSETTDTAIPSVLFSAARRYPEMSGLVEWLVDEHNAAWTIEVVHELRAITGVQPIMDDEVVAAGWAGI